MYRKPNPIPERGNRNLFCLHYRNCLNFAVRLQWDRFACIKCPFESTTGIESKQSMPSGDTTPYFTLSSDIHPKTKAESY